MCVLSIVLLKCVPQPWTPPVSGLAGVWISLAQLQEYCFSGVVLITLCAVLQKQKEFLNSRSANPKHALHNVLFCFS